MFLCACVRVFVSDYVCVYVYMSICVRVYMCACLCVLLCLCVRVYIFLCVCVRACVCVCTFPLALYTAADIASPHVPTDALQRETSGRHSIPLTRDQITGFQGVVRPQLWSAESIVPSCTVSPSQSVCQTPSPGVKYILELCLFSASPPALALSLAVPVMAQSRPIEPVAIGDHPQPSV